MPLWTSVILILSGLAVSATWFLSLFWVRTEAALFFPLSAACAMAAVFQGISARPKRPSTALLVASVSTALCAIVIPWTMWMASLRTISSGWIAVCFVQVPFWHRFFFERRVVDWPSAIGLALGSAAYAFGIWEDNGLRGGMGVPLALSIGAIGILAFASHLARTHHWRFDVSDLGFWSCVSATALSFVLGVVTQEAIAGESLALFHLFFLVAVGGVFLVGGPAMYRLMAYQAKRGWLAFLSAVVPVSAWVIGIAAWEETPFNAFTAVGVGAVSSFLVHACLRGTFASWLTQWPLHTKRAHPRCLCHFEGTLRPVHGDVGRLWVTDLSESGVGFVTDTAFKKGDSAVLTLHLEGIHAEVSVECKIAHVERAKDTQTWSGGLEIAGQSKEFRSLLRPYLQPSKRRAS